MRSRNPSLAPPPVELRDSGRLGTVVLGTSEDREDFTVAAGFVAGRVVVDGFWVTFCSSPCLAAEAAVGAVSREGKPTGRVGDFGRGFLKPLGETLVLRQ